MTTSSVVGMAIPFNRINGASTIWGGIYLAMITRTERHDVTTVG